MSGVGRATRSAPLNPRHVCSLRSSYSFPKIPVQRILLFLFEALGFHELAVLEPDHHDDKDVKDVE